MYDILGVPSSASADEIKLAYRASILKYHPDVNKAPNAQRLTEMLNSAYEVLSDAVKRREYDAQVQSGNVSSTEPGEPAQELWDLLTCDGCGNVDPQLRFANFFRVWSIVLFTRMSGIGGVLCPTCRSRRAGASALFSATLGPWGFPWGLFYTLRALIASARGGEFPRLENAQLLRHQAIAFLQRNMLSAAVTNFQASLKFEKNDNVVSMLTESFFSGIPTLPKVAWLRGQTIGLASFAIPVIVLLFLTWASSIAASSSSSPGDTTSAQSAGDSGTPEPAETTPAFQTICLKSTRSTDAKVIHVACTQARQYLANRREIATEQTDKDDFTVLGAMAEYQEAVAAQRLGFEHEAAKEGDEAIAAFGAMKDSAVDPDAKKAAARYYDCYKLNECK